MLIEQRSAALVAPKQPVFVRPQGCSAPAEEEGRISLSVHSGIYKFLQLVVVPCKSETLADHEVPVCLSRGGDHFIAFLYRGSHRLFANDIYARLEAQAGTPAVQIGGKCYGYEIELFFCEHLLEVGVQIKAAEVVAGGADIAQIKIRLVIGEFLFVYIAESDHFYGIALLH